MPSEEYGIGDPQRREAPWTHEQARAEYERYKRHGKPSRPIYVKCLTCVEAYGPEETVMDADNTARRHAGYHGGLCEESAEVAVVDSCGRELFRIHALFQPDQLDTSGCSVCGEPAEPYESRVTCASCGHIPEEHRA